MYARGGPAQKHQSVSDQLRTDKSPERHDLRVEVGPDVGEHQLLCTRFRRIMGTKKMLTFVALVVVMATFTGYVFGLIT